MSAIACFLPNFLNRFDSSVDLLVVLSPGFFALQDVESVVDLKISRYEKIVSDLSNLM